MGKGILGGMFDFNNDGHMSSFERAAEFHFISERDHYINDRSCS